MEKVIIGVSNRHIHLSAEDRDVLFGKDCPLDIKKPLLQPGQFAAEQVVTVEGPKGSIDKVRVLGPLRSQTQVELSVTDTFKLGIEACVRSSGDLKGSPGVKVHGPNGSVEIPEGAIVAARHVHLSAEFAERNHIQDRQMVKMRIDGPRAAVFEEVLVRVSKDFVPEIHIDMDEANAVQAKNNDYAEILI